MKTTVTMSRTMAQLVLEQTQQRLAELQKQPGFNTCGIGSPLWVQRWDCQRIKSHIERQLAPQKKDATP